MTRLLHLSDLHLNARGETRYGIDADRSLQIVLEACTYLDRLDAVVVTGDIADDGSGPAYVRAREMLMDFASPRGLSIHFAVGNHDDRTQFSDVLGSGHLDPSGRDCATKSGLPSRVSAVSVVGGLRIITLDSLVPGYWYGRLGPEQIAWLSATLAEDPQMPTVLALHHPPITLDVSIQQRVQLQDRDELAGALGAGTVSAILCGHFHQQIAGSLNGVPTWVTPGCSLGSIT